MLEKQTVSRLYILEKCLFLIFYIKDRERDEIQCCSINPLYERGRKHCTVLNESMKYTRQQD